MKLLFQKSKPCNLPEPTDFPDVRMHVPTPSHGFSLPGEALSAKQICTRMMFWAVSHGKAKLYYIIQDGEIAHTSYLIPKCHKFPFLSSDDYEIGPCATHPQYRGRGLYPCVLNHICRTVGNENSVFYMIVDEGNASSVRGIEKAGFERCGSVRITKFTKQYQRE